MTTGKGGGAVRVFWRGSMNSLVFCVVEMLFQVFQVAVCHICAGRSSSSDGSDDVDKGDSDLRCFGLHM